MREWALSLPYTGEDASCCWVRDFSQSLNLKEEAAEIDLFHLAVGEFITDDVVHQYAVVDTKRLRNIDSWYMDTGTDRAHKFAHRQKPTNFKVS